MGMEMGLYRLSSAEMAEVVETPDVIEDLIFGTEDSEEDPVELYFGPPETVVQLDLDKSWQVIHFLLTGSDYDGDPPANALLGGETVGEEEIGYALPVLLTPQEVAAFADYLGAHDNDALLARWDGDAMLAKDIYLGAPRDDTETVEYVLHYVDRLRIFTRATAKRGEGLLVTVT